MNGIDSLISLSDFSLLEYRSVGGFWVLILYPVTLLNSLISSSNFLMVSLGFSIYTISSVGATPLPRSGAADESARLQWHRSGQEKLPNIPSQGRWLGGAIPRLRSGAVAESARLQWHRSSQEELPHI